MTSVSTIQPQATPAYLLQAQQAYLGAAAQANTTLLAGPATGALPGQPPPSIVAPTPAPTPGRFNNPAQHPNLLAFGPSPTTSALTRTYTPTGQLVPAPPTAVDLFAQPVRGINYLA